MKLGKMFGPKAKNGICCPIACSHAGVVILSVLISAVFICSASQATDQTASSQKLRLERHADVHGFRRGFSGKPIEQMTPNAFGEIDLSGGLLILHAQMPGSPTPSLSGQLRHLAKESILVVRASAESYISALTKDHAFIYSDWTMKISEVYKNASGHSVRQGDEITVTRTGGRLVWNSRVAYAHDANFPDFVVGEDYVLYLRRVPDDPDSYLATNEGSFRIDNTGIHYLADRNDMTDSLSALVRDLATNDFLAKVKENIQ